MHREISKFAVLATIILLAGCAETTKQDNARPQIISGAAVAVDGDTVKVGDVIMDLWGIEAPNLSNSDGWIARAALDDLIGTEGTLACTVKVKTRRRTHAVCSNNRVGDVGRSMLQGGWAIMARGDKRNEQLDGALVGVYARTEKRARESRAGLWSRFPNP